MRVELTGNAPAESAPRPKLSLTDAVSMIVGIVVGAGIFKAPSIVAANAGSEITTSIYLLQASLSYTGIGVAVLLAGLPVLMLARR